MKQRIKDILEILGYMLVGSVYILLWVVILLGGILIFVWFLAFLAELGGFFGVIINIIEYLVYGIVIVIGLLAIIMVSYQVGEGFILDFKAGRSKSIPGYLGILYGKIRGDYDE